MVLVDVQRLFVAKDALVLRVLQGQTALHHLGVVVAAEGDPTRVL